MQWIRRRWSGGSAKPDFNEIVIIAAPRSGTNFFCECLGALPEVAGFYEVFNREGVFGLGGRILPVVCDRLGLTEVESAKDPRLIKVFREPPWKHWTPWRPWRESTVSPPCRTKFSRGSYRWTP